VLALGTAVHPNRVTFSSPVSGRARGRE
jgi:hypothetical protein